MQRAGNLRKLVQQRFSHSVIEKQFQSNVASDSKRLETREWLMSSENFGGFTGSL